ncbi:hypothetical protein VNO77_03063 [Canavalia gladiata]|uniref:Uncharacterized protein n=1 Tax=Canavalia gladiata TaxID=3824 RepID=A0AAN9R6H3_CANGL
MNSFTSHVSFQQFASLRGYGEILTNQEALRLWGLLLATGGGNSDLRLGSSDFPKGLKVFLLQSGELRCNLAQVSPVETKLRSR